MKRKKIILILCSSILALACIGIIVYFVFFKVSRSNYRTIENAVIKTNSEQIYKASFVLEVKDAKSDDLIIFIQGNYAIDKSHGTVLEGDAVQTVFNMPSSFRVGYYDNTYVTISDGYKVLSTLEEETFLEQFMCSPAICFNYDDIISIEKSQVTNGIMFTVKTNNNVDRYFSNLLGDDLYEFSSMKKPQKDLTDYSDFVCKYVVDEKGYLSNRESTYTITAQDTPPYTPGNTVSEEEYQRKFSVSLKVNYKEFGDHISVDVTDFLPDTSEESSYNISAE